ESECRRQSRAVDLERRDDFAELPAREVVRQPHEQPSRVFDGRKKCVNSIHNKLVAWYLRNVVVSMKRLTTLSVFPLQNMNPAMGGFQLTRTPPPDDAQPIRARH